jgi:tubulin-specific chaperone D
MLTAAACQLIADSISRTEIQLDEISSVPDWQKIIDYGLRHRSVDVRESAAAAMAAISKLTDCTSTVKRYGLSESR